MTAPRRLLLLSLVLVGGLVPRPALAQAPNPVEVYNAAVQAIGAQKWDEGLEPIRRIIQEYETDGKKIFGPVFGHFYFLRGLLELGKEDYAAAAKSFQICYEDFPNDTIKSDPGSPKNKKPNTFRYQALVQWANVLMKQERYEVAAEKYDLALKEGDLATRERWFAGVNMGRCLIKAGKTREGYDLIVKPLANAEAPAGLRRTIFMILAEDWTPQMELRPVREFLNEFRAVVQQDRLANRYERNDRFQYLAQQAIAIQDPIRALAWYGLMVDPRLVAITEEEIAELKAIEVAPENEEEKQRRIDERIAERKERIAEYNQILNGIGTAHFQMKSFTASFVAFRELSEKAPFHEEHPVYLHNTVVSAAQISRWKAAYHHGKQFLDQYPEHELFPAVSRVLVEVVFLRGEYAEAHEIAGDVRQDMELGSSMRDIPDFVYGASSFHFDSIEEAGIELGSYLKTYEDGERREPAMFYAGLSKVRLQKWEDAADLLNRFLEAYPGSQMVPSALYQCALAEFMLDRFEPALAKLERVIGEFPQHEVIASAWNLKGDLLASSEDSDFEEVEDCYLRGKNLADQIPGQEETAAYSLWQLLIQNADRERWETAEGHYDEFQEKHAGSAYRLDVLVAALPLLVERDRTEEALQALRAVIRLHQHEPTSPELAEMFGSYLDFLEENLESPEAVLAELEEQRRASGTTATLDGWLRIAMIQVYDELEAGEEARAQQFFQLHSRFQPEKHSNYVIVQLARWLARERVLPGEARALYDFLLEKRPGSADYDYVLLDTAELQARSEDPQERAQAMEKFREVRRVSPRDELQELAVLGMARLLTKEGTHIPAVILQVFA